MRPTSSLGTSRFLKTIRARHHAGRIVVKVFVKTDPTLSLKSQFKRLQGHSSLSAIFGFQLTQAAQRKSTCFKDVLMSCRTTDALRPRRLDTWCANTSQTTSTTA